MSAMPSEFRPPAGPLLPSWRPAVHRVRVRPNSKTVTRRSWLSRDLRWARPHPLQKAGRRYFPIDLPTRFQPSDDTALAARGSPGRIAKLSPPLPARPFPVRLSRRRFLPIPIAPKEHCPRAQEIERPGDHASRELADGQSKFSGLATIRPLVRLGKSCSTRISANSPMHQSIGDQ